MGKRREGREAALQFLFSHDLNASVSEQEKSAFWELRRTSPSVRAFAQELIDGVSSATAEIDAQIAGALENFSIERLSGVERNILRIAVHEMTGAADIPPVVSINEAVEIAKRFGGTDSGRFVNGVLDRIHRELSSRE